MPSKCSLKRAFPQIGPKGCTLDGLLKKKRVSKKTGPKPSSTSLTKRVIVPSKRIKSTSSIKSAKRKTTVLPGSTNPKKRKYVVSVEIGPSKRIKSAK